MTVTKMRSMTLVIAVAGLGLFALILAPSRAARAQQKSAQASASSLADALFVVSHESRAVVLSLYTPLHSTLPGSPAISYNAAIDVFCLRYIREDACYEFRGCISKLLPCRCTH